MGQKTASGCGPSFTALVPERAACFLPDHTSTYSFANRPNSSPRAATRCACVSYHGHLRSRNQHKCITSLLKRYFRRVALFLTCNTIVCILARPFCKCGFGSSEEGKINIALRSEKTTWRWLSANIHTPADDAINCDADAYRSLQKTAS